MQLVCVIILASYFFIRTNVFQRSSSGHGSFRDKVILVLVFGAFSIYGNISGIWLYGSEANVRDLGPVIAGLLFGPGIGISSAIIGAVFRFSLGGVTVIPCTLTTLIAGILAGLVWWVNKKKYIGTFRAILFILLLEIIHLTLIILLSGTSIDVLAIVTTMWILMVPLYVIGISVFSIIYEQYVAELKEHEELQRQQIELNSATEIQRGFLPKEMPTLPGYEIYASSTPAREVGGDFFDFISFDNGDLGLVIADVSGKSVPAALFMGLSCTAVRVCSRWVFSPSSLLGQVNSLIVRYAESGMFFSIFFALLKSGSGCISYVNAGHPSPVLIRDSQILELSRTGPIIGFMDGEDFFEKEITLQDGDLLVCYTDGVTEAKRSDGEMFGKKRLIQVVKSSREEPVHDINDMILAEISRFAGDAPQFDDISLLIVKKTACL
ncbi:SpoIIE family protein phosphatase [uncultured Methanospirillum sp.]|uniref:PP2C family protein-serine/threonine phosphatase n=1 Tax=uncultured Methanospirillum sp. TaxID=262503 RepID=UPI0029C803D6|nr:SpoIIE family protein phosphatase [uncultured Methanospirillum sp.]